MSRACASFAAGSSQRSASVSMTDWLTSRTQSAPSDWPPKLVLRAMTSGDGARARLPEPVERDVLREEPVCTTLHIFNVDD